MTAETTPEAERAAGRARWAGLFAVTSLLAAAATSGPMLVGARVLQGVGGATIFPTPLSLLNAAFGAAGFLALGFPAGLSLGVGSGHPSDTDPASDDPVALGRSGR